MKKNLTITLFLASILLVGCSPKKPLLSGQYDKVVTVESSKTFEQIWTLVIDYFAVRGIGIQTIDKSSGLIVSNKHSLIDTWTYETKGRPDKAAAWVVLRKTKGLRPKSIEGNFNIRIKAVGTLTQINVNLVNLTAISTKDDEVKWRFMNVASTGVFENEIANSLK